MLQGNVLVGCLPIVPLCLVGTQGFGKILHCGRPGLDEQAISLLEGILGEELLGMQHPIDDFCQWGLNQTLDTRWDLSASNFLDQCFFPGHIHACGHTFGEELVIPIFHPSQGFLAFGVCNRCLQQEGSELAGRDSRHIHLQGDGLGDCGAAVLCQYLIHTISTERICPGKGQCLWIRIVRRGDVLVGRSPKPLFGVGEARLQAIGPIPIPFVASISWDGHHARKVGTLGSDSYGLPTNGS